MASSQSMLTMRSSSTSPSGKSGGTATISNASASAATGNSATSGTMGKAATSLAPLLNMARTLVTMRKREDWRLLVLVFVGLVTIGALVFSILAWRDASAVQSELQHVKKILVRIQDEVCDVNDRVLEARDAKVTSYRERETRDREDYAGIDVRFARECEMRVARAGKELRTLLSEDLARGSSEVVGAVASVARTFEESLTEATSTHSVFRGCVRTPGSDSYPVEIYERESLPEERPGARLPLTPSEDPNQGWDPSHQHYRVTNEGLHRIDYHLTSLLTEVRTVFVLGVERASGPKHEALRLDVVPSSVTFERDEAPPPSEGVADVIRDSRSHDFFLEVDLRRGDAVFLEAFVLADSRAGVEGSPSRLSLTQFCGANYLSLRWISPSRNSTSR